MSTLTKTFIILNLIFSIAFVMVSATVLSQQDDWKKKYTAQQTTNSETVAALTEERDTTLASNVGLKDKLLSSNTFRDEFERKLKDRITELKAANANIDKLERRGGILDASVGKLSQDVELLDSNLTAARKSLDLAKEELKNTKASLGVRNMTVVALQAQVAGLDLRLKDVLYRYNLVMAEKKYFEDIVEWARRNGGVLQTTAVTQKFVATPKILSIVRLVGPKSKIVVLGVGSKSKEPVKKGYEFLIYRDRTYVASVRVSNVDEDMCAARVIDPTDDKAVIQVGDRAITKYNK